VKFLLLIYFDPVAVGKTGAAERAAATARNERYQQELLKAGVLVASNALHMASTAATVRVRGADRSIADGPHADGPEQLGGYYLIDCENMDEAVEWAARMPAASFGAVEVRPVLTGNGHGEREEKATVRLKPVK